MDFAHEKRLTEVEARAKSNSHRIDKLEEQTEAISNLATSMAVMVEKQEEVAKKVDTLSGKIGKLEEKPAKMWDSVVEKAVWAVVAAVVGFLLAKIGL